MTAHPSDPQSAGNPSDPVAAGQAPIALTFEDKLQLFWRRNSTMIVAVCIVVAVAIIGFGLWERHEAGVESDTEAAYAKASTPEALKAFALANPEHSLAGVAYLRLADEAFAAGKTADALTNYEKAAKIFKDGPLAARTKLGLAVTKVVGGKAAEGTTELKQLAEDSNQFKGIRAEATYHLASLAAEAGNVADVQKYFELIMQVDPSSPWAQRAMLLRAEFPVTPAASAAAPAAASGAPAIQLPAPAK
jgi:predicted negative regulator of RcsB-dependent stress response